MSRKPYIYIFLECGYTVQDTSNVGLFYIIILPVYYIEDWNRS